MLREDDDAYPGVGTFWPGVLKLVSRALAASTTRIHERWTYRDFIWALACRIVRLNDKRRDYPRQERIIRNCVLMDFRFRWKSDQAARGHGRPVNGADL